MYEQEETKNGPPAEATCGKNGAAGLRQHDGGGISTAQSRSEEERDFNQSGFNAPVARRDYSRWPANCHSREDLERAWTDSKTSTLHLKTNLIARRPVDKTR